MPSRRLASRVAALLLAALLSLTGSGASIAHGIAHVREHRAAGHHDDVDHHGVDHHGVGRLAVPAGVAHDDGHHDDGHHDDGRHDDGRHDDGDGAHGRPAPRVDATGDVPEAAAPDGPATHQHARLDALAVSRLAIAAFLPAPPVRVAAPPLIAATVQAPPAASPLRLAEPPTGPPPPSRAPPLG